MSGTAHHRWLSFYAGLTALTTLCLICVGGLVTSHGAGMAVPDWPTTFGYNMFFFPIDQWVGGIFYEHSHRLVASLVGLMTVGLAVGLWLGERRPWLRLLGWVAVFVVVLQGVLGGLRVTAMKDAIGVFHAVLAQLFFVLICAIALFTSRWWGERPACRRRATVSVASKPVLAATETVAGTIASETLAPLPDASQRNLPIYDRKGMRYLYALASGMILLQLILGATMRHQHAGLAIPDFPMAYGALWPAMDGEAVARYNQMRGEITALNPITAFGVGLQMAHRLGALMVLLGVAGAAWLTRRQFGGGHLLTKLSLAWLGWIVVQAGLGAATIWTNKSADIATAHVAVGALSLVTGAFLVLMARRCAQSPVASIAAETDVALTAPFADRHIPA